MSYIGTAVSAFQAVSGLSRMFGGGGGNNVAKGFSKECGFSKPIPQAMADQARTQARITGQDPCTVARNAMLGGRGVVPGIDVPRTPDYKPNFPTVAHKPDVVGAVLGAVTGSKAAMASPYAGAASIGGALSRLGTVAGIIRGASGKILRVILPSGRAVTRKNAVALAKRVGMDLAAATLGITVYEMAQMVMDEQSTRRRRRGLSHRDIQNARRVACTVSKMARDLNVKPAPRTRGTCR